jgi:hypothetical protein
LGRRIQLWAQFALRRQGATVTSYDVSRDGQRFLMTKDNDQNTYATRIVIAVNWVEELKRLIAEASDKMR